MSTSGIEPVALLCFICFSTIISGASVKSLYGEGDNIVVLDIGNFNRTVLGSSNAWLIEFYSSWCGHCIRYAPQYKELAKDVKGWKSIIAIAAVDCAHEANTPLCRYYEITQFPTIKLFPASPMGTQLGCDNSASAGGSIQDVRRSLVDFISNSSVSQIPSPTHHVLQPIRSIDEMKLDAVDTTERTYVVCERNDSYIGREVILDLFDYRPAIVVRRLYASVAVTYGVRQFPSLHVLDDTRWTIEKLAGAEDRHHYVDIIVQSVNQRSHGDVTSENKMAANVDLNQHDDLITSQRFGDRVHEHDLESTLYYSLHHEVAQHKSISGRSLIALQLYVRTLYTYLPIESSVQLFLKSLSDWLDKCSESLSGIEWRQALDRLQTSSAYMPESTTYTGCRGSASKYRGYPCGLWMTFHALTVSAAASNQQESGFDPQSVLVAIRGYVEYFFGCRECSDNFMRGAVHIESRVRTADDAILFLWRSHNKANARLTGDLTEDPEHVKVQFPTVEQCRRCHDDGTDSTTWSETDVLDYLKQMYGVVNFVKDSMGYLDNGAKREDGINAEVKWKMDYPSDGQSSLFGTVDVSLCLIFYVVCSAIIVFGYVQLIKHRGYRIFNQCRRESDHLV